MKKLMFILSLAGIAAGSVIFGAVVVQALWYSPNDQTKASLLYVASRNKGEHQGASIQGSSRIAERDLPRRLFIPSLAIDAAVEPVGLNRNGNMTVPSRYSDVSWYRYGPIPGEYGSAVVAGHVDNGLGLPGVFDQLQNIRVGEKIVVTTEGGRELVFDVEEIRTYPYAEAPLDHIFTRNDKVRLNLITCIGDWSAEQKTYDSRLVVFALLRER